MMTINKQRKYLHTCNALEYLYFEICNAFYFL